MYKYFCLFCAHGYWLDLLYDPHSYIYHLQVIMLVIFHIRLKVIKCKHQNCAVTKITSLLVSI